ncbi:hypothetical protein [Flavobacterium sp. 1355]|uniref:hypothetical protein n=1 Tax=Flavobacterium sp. 1355 TaxID=2806571 RepID=UPI001AE6A288|nr:hypothetical protein [Flavobacterium sp. 1355]MBP1224869.1 hypothetical protein [Flavobacterium sp. 1355]
MKRILITAFFLSLFININAQKKKSPAKTTATKTTVEKVDTTKGINENNYGSVVQYINEIVSCLNKQQKELSDREEYYKTWSDYFLNNKSNSKNKVIYSPYISYDLTKNNARCTKADAPNIMETTDVSFYNENYNTLGDTFQKIALIWNDMASFSKPNVPTLDYGKKKCEELSTLLDTYYQTREKLSLRNKQLQKQLFPYSVAKSPYKVAYTNLYNDLDAIKDFISLCTSSNNLNSDSIKNSLIELEGPVSEHLLYGNENQTPSNYKDFYETASKYIVLSTKAKLNGKGLQSKDIEQLVYNYNNYLIPSYNNAMR